MIMLKISERHSKILELLSENHKIEVVRLAEIMNVSQVTVRKDLQALEDKGLIKREHGYATINSSDDMNTRLAYHYEIKKKITKLAAKDVGNGETVMIESGSCCALLALELAQTKKDITIITNSAFIAEFIRKTTAHIILLGGEYQKESQVMVGPMTRKCAEAFMVDKLFIGTDGFDRHLGFTGNDYSRSQTVQDLANQARHINIVTESLKFTQTGIVSLLPPERIANIYTDNDIPKDIEMYLLQKNVLVKKAKITK